MDTVERHHRQVYQELRKAAHRVKREEGYNGTTKTTGDFANQAMIHIIERNPKVLEPGELKSDQVLRCYLWVVVRNTIRDQRDRDGASKRPPRGCAVPLDAVVLPCDGEGVEHQVMQRESAERLRVLLEQFENATLPNLKEQRQQRLAAVFRKFIDGHTHEEIATLCNIDRSQVSRDIEFMAVYLREQLDESHRSSR